MFLASHLLADLIKTDCREIPLAELGAILVASPHPDDETLGCGGLIGTCAKVTQPIPLTVLAMTNGEASHPGDRKWREKLGKLRHIEQLRALKTLGWPHPDLLSLGLPDGRLDQLSEPRRTKIVETIRTVINSRNIKSFFVPAIDDRHGDHRATAVLFAEAVANQPVKFVFSYQIWPPEARAPRVLDNEDAYSLNISGLVDLKKTAIQQHRTQLGPAALSHTEGFCMPQLLLDEKLKEYETYALIRNFSAWSGGAFR